MTIRWSCPKCNHRNMDYRRNYVICVNCGAPQDNVPEKDTEVTPSVLMVHEPPFVVKLTYFQLSGKYYSEGEYSTKKAEMYEIFVEVREMLEKGKRPGLVDGANEFYAYVEVPDHPHNHPALIIPRERL